MSMYVCTCVHVCVHVCVLSMHVSDTHMCAAAGCGLGCTAAPALHPLPASALRCTLAASVT